MFQAVIFDMNGVIIEDERNHQQSWRKFCEDHGFQLSEEEFKREVFGRRESETFEFLFKRKLSEEEVNKYSNERVDIAIPIFKPIMEATPGLLEFLRYLKDQHVPMALATSSRKRYLEFIFDGLNLWQYFQVIVTSEDVKKGKPDPEVYLKAATQLGIPAEHCLAIEDSLSGIKSAQAAGMKVIGIATTHAPEEILQADKVILSFQQQSFEELLKF